MRPVQCRRGRGIGPSSRQSPLDFSWLRDLLIFESRKSCTNVFRVLGIGQGAGGLSGSCSVGFGCIAWYGGGFQVTFPGLFLGVKLGDDTQ